MMSTLTEKSSFLQRVAAGVSRLPLWATCIFAAAVTLGTLLVRMQLGVFFAQRPLLILFVFPIILSAYVGGLWPGLLSTLIAAVSVDYLLIPPVRSLRIAETHDFVQWLMLILSGVLVSALNESLRRFQRRHEAVIAGQSQGEAALRESEQKFSAIFEASPYAIALTKMPERTLVGVNDAFLKLFEFTPEELIGRTSVDLGISDPNSQAKVGAELQAHGKVRNFEASRTTKAGARRALSLNLDWVNIGGEKHILTTISDITERKQAEEKLEQQNQRLKALREIDTAILAADSLENIVGAALSHICELIDCQRASLALIDWGANEGLIFDVRTMSETFMPKGTRVPMALFQDMNQTLSKKQLVLINDLTALPSPPPLFQTAIEQGVRSVCVLPLFSQDNLIGAFSMSSELPGFFNDERIDLGREVANQVAIAITQNNLVEALQDLNADLEARVIERTAQLQAANKELEAFSYSVSHDLRAPLRAIDGYTRILLEDYEAPLDEEGRRISNVIRAEAQRMGDLIDDLLQFSRLSRAEMEKVPIDMTAMANSVFGMLTTPEGWERIDFRVRALPEASGDPALMQQVWMNLLANAIKFTSKRERAVIEVGGSQNEKECVYYVRDNGAGFDMEYAGKLFGVFQRLHSESEFEGTGVGLAIVQRVIHRHGGRVWAEAESNKGATFYFSLPFVKPESFAELTLNKKEEQEK